jgi:hypothetical protein
MACEEKTRLTIAYQEATEKFSTSVTELEQSMGRVSKEEYARLQRASDEWRVHSEERRLALEQHIAAHKC